MFVNIFIFVIGTLGLLYYYLTKNFTYWKKKNVVYIKPIPFAGNYAEVLLFKTSAGELHKKFYDMYPNEKIFGCFKGKDPVLCVNDLDLLKHVMTKDFYYFSSRGFNNNLKIEPLNKSLFHVDGDYWKVLRQHLTPLFSSAKLRNMFYLIAECNIEFERFLDITVKKNSEIDLREVMPKLTTEVIGSCAFGLQMQSLIETDSIFRIMGKRIFDINNWKAIKTFLRSLSPSLFYFLKFRIMDKEVEHFFLNIVKQISQSRQGKNTVRHDFIDLMMEIRKKGHIVGSGLESYINKKSQPVNIEVDDQLMAAQSFIFFAAGFETSSTTMSHALYEMAQNRDIQKRAQQEIELVLEKHEGKLTYEAVKEMTYLDMIISETLRKYPVIGNLNRKCTSKYKIPDTDIVIEKGTAVVIPLRGIHYDPRYYPKPDLFDPERFLPEEILKRHPYSYMPFGEGPRNCIGLRFAKMQTMAGLISVLKKYTVVPCSRTEPVIEIDPRSIITTAKNGIWVKLMEK